jgi:CheY-like chemotaxis protein
MDLYLESFDLNALIAEIVSTIQPMVAKNANELKIESVADLGRMHGDKVKVRQALFNLLSNAAKFTHEGFITLKAERQEMDGAEWIVFGVTDTGIGLSEEEILKLFQDFTQADASTTRKFGGTGLGLALTRRFCQMMGGDVTVRSAPGEGSTFTIKVPSIVHELSVDDEVNATEDTGEIRSGGDRRSTDPISASRTCVLVIDDNEAQRDLMQRFLNKEGYSVRCASSGEEGLRMAKEIGPMAITLDVMMPGMDGWRVLEALRADAALSDIPVIMLTMVDDPERAFALGATDYVTKPVNRAKLSRLLKQYSCANPPCPILLIDDEPRVRAAMRRVLENSGCRVTEAENGEVALARMEEERPSLIFLDLIMPVMDGFVFAERVRAHADWRSIPIVVVTAHDLSPAERNRLRGGVETIVQKSGRTNDQLLGQVRDALRHRTMGRAVLS